MWKIPNTELFLVQIFPYSVLIRTTKDSVFEHFSRSLNGLKKETEILGQTSFRSSILHLPFTLLLLVLLFRIKLLAWFDIFKLNQTYFIRKGEQTVTHLQDLQKQKQDQIIFCSWILHAAGFLFDENMPAESMAKMKLRK